MLCKIITLILFLALCNAHDPCTCSKEINQLKAQIASLRRQVSSNTGKLRKCCQFSYVNDGWVTLHNGYQYKKTPSTQSWTASRSVCQRWGGDLAFHGFYNFQYRETLYRVLSINQPTWIGLSDRDIEGRWVFVNGQRVDNSKIRWSTGQPDNHGNREDCGEVRFGNFRGRTNDYQCHRPQHAICEKRY